MSENKRKDALPVLITRGVVLFPGHLTTIDAARTMSVNAINVAKEQYNDMIFNFF